MLQRVQKGGVLMMEVEVITQLIGSIGFPIAAFIMIFYMMNTTLKEVQTTMSENTKAIIKLLEKLDGGEND